MPNTEHDAVVHVAVAVIVNQAQQVLIARRPDHAHQGGLWEFPGGKVEPGETAYTALCREIREELQLDILSAKPLIKLLHRYHDKSVILDVWQVTDFMGEPHGAEGQPLRWQAVADLDATQFPAANRKIISTLLLPEHLLITGEFTDQQDFARRLSRVLQSGVRLVQLRCKSKCDAAIYPLIAQTAKALCESAGARLLLNSDPHLANELAVGLHLNSHDLFNYQQRPVPQGNLLSVSCHNADDLQQSARIQADFVLLSPVKKTSSHPDMDGMGWLGFSHLAATINLPVYALGGMRSEDLDDARQAGAQGVAAISAFWSSQ